MVLKAKEKVVQRLIAARFEDISILIFAFDGYFVKASWSFSP